MDPNCIPGMYWHGSWRKLFQLHPKSTEETTRNHSFSYSSGNKSTINTPIQEHLGTYHAFPSRWLLLHLPLHLLGESVHLNWNGIK